MNLVYYESDIYQSEMKSAPVQHDVCGNIPSPKQDFGCNLEML